MDSPPEINIVVPLYNEVDVFDSLIERLNAVMEKSPRTVSVIFVDDGSLDATPRLMHEQSMKDDRYTSIFLSRNFGHQKALSAGLAHVDATKAVFVLDADLQDPPELLDEFYTHIEKGHDVVYAVREKRKEGFFIKLFFKLFYLILKAISSIDIPTDTGDFGLISRRVVDQLNAMPEQSRYLRGMRSWVGFKQIGVRYERQKREHGDSKYSFRKRWEFAMDGIFNFSLVPIKLIMLMGVLAISTSVIYFGITLAKKLMYDTVTEGFTALLFMIILFGGAQLLAIGILGEYILRIFVQVKNRPLFVVKSVIRKSKEKFG